MGRYRAMEFIQRVYKKTRIMKKKVFVFIFVRAGSKGIPNKNLKKINGKSLIEISLQVAKKLNPDKIFISSDSNKIEILAKKNSVNFIRRPKYLCTDKSPEILSWKYAINKVNENFDIFVSLPVTSPLRNVIDVKKCIKKKITQKNDIVVCVTRSKKNPYFNMLFKKNDYYKRIIPSQINSRQEAPIAFDLTTVSYVTSPSYVLKTKNILDGKVQGVEIPFERSIDIDDKFDLNLSKYLMTNR